MLSIRSPRVFNADDSSILPVTPYFRLLRLVLLVSCAHAMVHLLEQSIASVEQNISGQYDLTKRQSGLLGTAFRFPYGIGAILAGILADRLGPARVLTLYLAGAAVTCFSIPLTSTHSWLYVQLFVLGSFASMYHPAGLALLSNSTTLQERTRALGVHGVFGSTGIAAAPFLAGITLSFPAVTWQGYYLLLGFLSGVLALLIAIRLHVPPVSRQSTSNAADRPINGRLQRLPYLLLVTSAGISGVVYGGFLHFLKRYLSEVPGLRQTSTEMSAGDVTASYYAAIVLICGAAGQFLIGRVASARLLPQLLIVSYASNAPFLIWMAWADGNDRLVATCLLAFFHFTNQPLYNSLLAEYIPPGSRSTWFGFSNMIGFGVGAAGPLVVGSLADYRSAYLTLAALSLVAAAFPAILLSRVSAAKRQSASGTPGG